MLIKIFYLIFAIALISCNNKPQNLDRELSPEEQTAVASIKSISPQAGLTSLKANCYSCHNPNAESHDNMLAPPLAGIKYKYKSTYPDEALFVAQMSDFIMTPTKENALMKGPVRRFGLMPKTAMSPTAIKELVKYIYHAELASPDWFPGHFEEQHGTKWDDRG